MAGYGPRVRSRHPHGTGADVLGAAVSAAIVLIPATYLLLKALHLLLLATGLVHYDGVDQFLITGTSGALPGSSIVALLSANGTLKRQAEQHSAPVDVQGRFALEAAVRAPVRATGSGAGGGRGGHLANRWCRTRSAAAA